MVLFMKRTQRFNDEFKIRLIHCMINPYFISVSLLITLLFTYKGFVNLILDSNGAQLQSLDIKGDGVIDLTADYIGYGKKMTDMANDLLYYIENITVSRIKDLENSVIGDFDLKNDDVSSFNDALELLTSEYSDLLSNLNRTIMQQLITQQSVIQGYKDELTNSLFVGSSVDVSGLSLNISEISNDLIDAMNDKKLDFKNATNETVLDHIRSLFDHSISELQGYQKFNATNLGCKFQSSAFPSLVSSMKNTTNGTVHSHRDFNSKMNKTILTFGISAIVFYFVLLVYQYFKFQYEINVRLKKFIEIEKQTKFDELDEINYVDLVQDLHDVKVFALTGFIKDFLMLDNAMKEKVHWLGSYLFGVSSNLPFLAMAIILLVLLRLSIVTIEVDNVTSGSLTNKYELFDDTGIVSFEELDISDMMRKQYDYYNEISINLTNSLSDIYDSNSMTFNHSITLSYLNTSLPSINALLSNLDDSLSQLTIEAEIKMTRNDWVSPVKTIIEDLTNTIYNTLRVALIVAASAFLFIVFIGFVYSVFI